VTTAINHTELPFDELLETRLRTGDYADRVASRIMQDGWEVGVWIETDWDGPGPVARKMLAVNDLLDALRGLLWQWDTHKTLMGLSLADARAAIAKATGSCTHNAMVPKDEPGHAWKCADCGHVYSK